MRIYYQLQLFQSTLPARGATNLHRCLHPPEAHFNPRSPHGERPLRKALSVSPSYFNPRSPHGERPGPGLARKFRAAISIHAPRTGSDNSKENLLTMALISIHAPRTGSDAKQSITSSRARDFNPRSPHGERPNQAGHAPGRLEISIHAPRTGSDDSGIQNMVCHK